MNKNWKILNADFCSYTIKVDVNFTVPFWHLKHETQVAGKLNPNNNECDIYYSKTLTEGRQNKLHKKRVSKNTLQSRITKYSKLIKMWETFIKCHYTYTSEHETEMVKPVPKFL